MYNLGLFPIYYTEQYILLDESLKDLIYIFSVSYTHLFGNRTCGSISAFTAIWIIINTGDASVCLRFSGRHTDIISVSYTHLERGFILCKFLVANTYERFYSFQEAECRGEFTSLFLLFRCARVADFGGPCTYIVV